MVAGAIAIVPIGLIPKSAKVSLRKLSPTVTPGLGTPRRGEMVPAVQSASRTNDLDALCCAGWVFGFAGTRGCGEVVSLRRSGTGATIVGR
jgi:hypothetical protein